MQPHLLILHLLYLLDFRPSRCEVSLANDNTMKLHSTNMKWLFFALLFSVLKIFQNRRLIVFLFFFNYLECTIKIHEPSCIKFLDSFMQNLYIQSACWEVWQPSQESRPSVVILQVFLTSSAVQNSVQTVKIELYIYTYIFIIAISIPSCAHKST